MNKNDMLKIKDIVIGIVLFSLFILLISYLFMMNKKMCQKPQSIKKFQHSSFIIKINNNSNKIFKLNKVTFPKNTFIETTYDKNDKVINVVKNNDLKINTNTNNFLNFINTKIPNCKIINNKNIIKKCKEDKNDKLIITMKNDNINLEIRLKKIDIRYHLDVLETIKSNDKMNENIYKCNIQKNDKFLKNIGNLFI